MSEFKLNPSLSFTLQKLSVHSLTLPRFVSCMFFNLCLGSPDWAVFLFVLLLFFGSSHFCLFVRCVSCMMTHLCLGSPDWAVRLFVLLLFFGSSHFCLFVRCVSCMITHLCLGSPDRAVKTQGWCCCCTRAVGAHLVKHLISVSGKDTDIPR